MPHKRSHGSIQKKRQKRVRKVSVAPPKSSADDKYNSSSENIKIKELCCNAECTDLYGGTLIRVFKKILSESVLIQLEEYLDEHQERLRKSQDDCRGKHQVMFLGKWTSRGGKNFTKIQKTPVTANQTKGEELIWKFKDLWTAVSDLIRQHFPKMAEEYEKVSKEHRLFDLFTFLIINWTTAPKIHKDVNDWHNGFCCIFPFGEYDGGQLHFPSLNMKFNLRPGDVIVFQSHLLWHGNMTYNGNRHSCVLVTQNTVMNYSKAKTMQ